MEPKAHLLSPLLLVLFSLFFASEGYATTPQEEYKRIQKEINIQKEKLEKAKRHESSVLGDLERTNRQLSFVEAELRKNRNRLNNTASKITKVEAEISVHMKNIKRQNEWLKNKLRAMQKYGYSGEILMLFSNAEDVSKLMRRWDALQHIIVYDNRLLNAYKNNLKNLHEKERQLKILESELIKNEENVKATELALAEKRDDKEMLLVSIRREKSSYSRMLKELDEASKRLIEILRESVDTYLAKGFSGLKGKLHWPVEGRVAIPYGSQRDPQFNTPVFRSGIYIQADDDTLARAVYSGKVVFAEWFKGYGQLMIVTHGDGYHTLYGSLSEIFYRVGDIIKTEQIIGRVGNSGILNSPGLYFEVRYKGKPLDPLQWLKRR
ncbi:MAG: peptidoglycan DD-metalloendopeptidase family protein [Nitrospirota bacterium]